MAARYTVAEVAKRLIVDREVARGLVRFVVAVGLARECGLRYTSGVPAGEKVYEFDGGWEEGMKKVLSSAKI